MLGLMIAICSLQCGDSVLCSCHLPQSHAAPRCDRAVWGGKRLVHLGAPTPKRHGGGRVGGTALWGDPSLADPRGLVWTRGHQGKQEETEEEDEGVGGSTTPPTRPPSP